jgi:excalibur calcium-binding domain-containing protein
MSTSFQALRSVFGVDGTISATTEPQTEGPTRVKRTAPITAAALAVAGLNLATSGVPGGSALAPTTASAAVTTYRNCASLNRVYKHGVKKSSSSKDVVRSNGKITKKSSSAKTSAALYQANKKLDRDKDGIACEK